MGKCSLRIYQLMCVNDQGLHLINLFLDETNPPNAKILLVFNPFIESHKIKGHSEYVIFPNILKEILSL